MATAVKTEGLTKTYRLLMQKEPVNAVSDLNLEVNEGEIFGFLGPNGAGKTTTIKMLLGLAYPSAGSAWVLGMPAGDIEIKKVISYLPETPYFYDYMNPQELLDFYARLFGLSGAVRAERIESLLKLVGLYDNRYKPLNQFSKGMLQRAGIAQALINDPKLLFFDEPTSGLDPIAHAEIRDLILRLRDEGRTVFLSSHQLSDVELVCDRVAILNRGNMLKIGKLDELLVGGSVEVTSDRLDAATIDKLKSISERVQVEESIVIISVEDALASDKVIDVIRAANRHVLSVVPLRRTLEDLFVQTIKGVSK